MLMLCSCYAMLILCPPLKAKGTLFSSCYMGCHSSVQNKIGGSKQDDLPLGRVVLGSLSSSKKGWVRAPMAVTLVTGL